MDKIGAGGVHEAVSVGVERACRGPPRGGGHAWQAVSALPKDGKRTEAALPVCDTPPKHIQSFCHVTGKPREDECSHRPVEGPGRMRACKKPGSLAPAPGLDARAPGLFSAEWVRRGPPVQPPGGSLGQCREVAVLPAAPLPMAGPGSSLSLRACAEVCPPEAVHQVAPRSRALGRAHVPMCARTFSSL